MNKIINSSRSLAEIQGLLKREFEKNKYLTVKISSKKRSLNSNAFQFAVYKELEQQGDQTALEYRNFCKYHFGLQIRAATDPEFACIMRSPITKHCYEDRLKMMSFIDVTSTFNAYQMKSYLSQVIKHFTEHGYVLETN